jgi:hypothetical protein
MMDSRLLMEKILQRMRFFGAVKSCEVIVPPDNLKIAAGLGIEPYGL